MATNHVPDNVFQKMTAQEKEHLLCLTISGMYDASSDTVYMGSESMERHQKFCNEMIEKYDKFVFPSFDEVQVEFFKQVKDDDVSKTLARKFIQYNNNYIVDGSWTVKKTKKIRTPMKDWKAAVRTFYRNVFRYDKDLVVRIERNKLFNVD